MKLRPLPRFGTDPHLAFVRLHDLVNDRQSQSRAAVEARLEGLEDLFHFRPAHPAAGVGEADHPAQFPAPQRHRQRPAVRAWRAPRCRKCSRTPASSGPRPTGDSARCTWNRRSIRTGAVPLPAARFSSSVSVSSSRGTRSTDRELVLLFARIGEEVGDDVVQPLRLAGHDVHQRALLLVQHGNVGQHLHRAGDGGERIADLVRDRRRHPSHRRQPVAAAALRAPGGGFRSGRRRCRRSPWRPAPGLPAPSGVMPKVSAVPPRESPPAPRNAPPPPPGPATDPGTGSSTLPPTTLAGGRSSNAAPAALITVIRPSIAGGDQSAADRLHDVLVQRLQVFQRAALVLQFDVGLPQLGSAAGQVGDGDVREQVDENRWPAALRRSGGSAHRSAAGRSRTAPASAPSG